MTIASCIRLGLRLEKRPSGYAVTHHGQTVTIRPDAPAALGFLRAFAAALTESYTPRLVP